MAHRFGEWLLDRVVMPLVYRFMEAKPTAAERERFGL